MANRNECGVVNGIVHHITRDEAGRMVTLLVPEYEYHWHELQDGTFLALEVKDNATGESTFYKDQIGYKTLEAVAA